MSWTPSTDFIAVSEGGQSFEMDLSEGDWVDYDEKLNCEVSFMGLEWKFERA